MRPQSTGRHAGVQTFGQALRRIRSERGFSHKDVAVRVGVKKDQVRQWEDDETSPSNFHLKKLYGTFSTLRFFTDLLPPIAREKIIQKAEQIVSASRGVGQMPEDMWLPPVATRSEDIPEELSHTPRPTSFGGHLRAIRLSEGVDIEELAELMGVTNQAISAWELDKAIPVLDHYNKLQDLFPSLAKAPTPNSPDIPKPNGGKGIPKNVGNSNGAGNSGNFGLRAQPKTAPTLRAVPTAFDAIQHMPLAEPNPPQPGPEVVLEQEQEDAIEALPSTSAPATPLEALEQAGIDYARYLAARQREEFRLATLRAQLVEVEKAVKDAAELVKISHEKLIELATKQ